MLKRIYAFLIDTTIYIIFFFFDPYLYDFLNLITNNYISKSKYGIDNIIFIAIPVFYFIFFESVFGRSIGKWLLNLKIKSYISEKPNRFLLFLRSLLKIISILSLIGIILDVLILLLFKFVWYDKLLGLYIEYEKPIELSKTQAAWRRFFNLKK